MDWGRIARRVRDAYNTLLDAVLPPRAQTLRTQSRTLEDIPLMPTVHHLLGAHITTLMDYQRPAVRDLIRSLKYDGSAHAAHLCAMIVADYLREEIASIRLFSTHPIYIIPLPLHSARSRERGFNQIQLVLDRLPTEFRDGTLTTVTTDTLTRMRDTPHQTRLPRGQRIKNMNGAFALNHADITHLRDAHIFLIDDVTTTGATLMHAGRPLSKISDNVTLLALARA